MDSGVSASNSWPESILASIPMQSETRGFTFHDTKGRSNEASDVDNKQNKIKVLRRDRLLAPGRNYINHALSMYSKDLQIVAQLNQHFCR